MADPVHQRQGGQEGISLQRAPEDAKLHRGGVLEVDAGVAAGVAGLGPVQDVPGTVPIAVPGGPAIQLPLGPAAEFEELLPVLLKEVQHPGDGRLLLGIGVPEGLSAHMDVEAAGAGLVGEVAHADSLPEEGLPGHFGAVVAEGHGVGHQLEAVVQGAVVLAVEPGLTLVGDGEKAAGVVAVLTGLVDLQLHAEIEGPIPPEERGWAVVVVVDRLLVGGGPVAVRAVGLILVLTRRQVAGLVVGDKGAAAGADGVAVLQAGEAQGQILGAGVVPWMDGLAAAAAGDGFQHTRFLLKTK